MPVAVDFTVLGQTQVQRTLVRFQSRFLVATPALYEIQKSLERIAQQQFDSEGRRGSGGWAALAPSTIEFKARMGYPLKILERTGTLRDSLTRAFVPGSLRQVGPQTMTYGSTVPYGIFHQHGAPRGNLPRRPPVDLTNSDRVKFIKILQTYIVTGKVVRF